MSFIWSFNEYCGQESASGVSSSGVSATTAVCTIYLNGKRKGVLATFESGMYPYINLPAFHALGLIGKATFSIYMVGTFFYIILNVLQVRMVKACGHSQLYLLTRYAIRNLILFLF